MSPTSLLGRLLAARAQLGWLPSLRVAAAAAARRVLDPGQIPSYAQCGEDRLLDACLGGRDTGFYVDVGCHDPVLYSNTWKLYLRGWRGIAIDANRDVVARYRRVRPRDTAVACVVSDTAGPVQFYLREDDPRTSGVGPQAHGPWARTDANSRVEEHAPRRLTDVLDAHGAPRAIDLLSVDVEGHERAVLDSLDFERYRPALVLVELHGLDLDAPQRDPVYARLVELGYRCTGFTAFTGLFAHGRGGG